MIKFPELMQDFVKSQRTAVLAVPLANNGVHAAAMLFSFHASPAEFYFFTESGSIKMRAFEVNHTSSASLVIGTTEENKLTLQMSGVISKVEDISALREVKTIHYARFPESIPYENELTTFLSFAPHWYRFTDYHSRPPEIIQSS